MVSPLSGIPLLVLSAVWLGPIALRGRLPRLAHPLLGFVLIAGLGASLVPFHGLPPWKDQDAILRSVRALVTLAIGVAFYLTASTIPKDDSRLRASLAWLSVGAILTLAWATFQSSLMPFSNPVPPRIQEIHHLFVIQDMFRTRVSGLAYEPSWLADQLVLLYFPMWLGLILQRQTAFPWRLRGLTLELLLLLWGIFVLFRTFSRAGYVTALALLAALLISRGWSWSGWVAARLARGRPKAVRWPRVLVAGAMGIGFLAVSLIGLVAAARVNPRIARVFDLNLGTITRSERFPWPYALANRLEYGERLVYWVSAFRGFSQSPILGVGLGVSGFTFAENVPSYGYYLPEILENLDPGSGVFPNPKSLWVRLLAETGAVGFSAFLIWLVGAGYQAGVLRRGSSPILRALGIAGGLSLVALAFEGFSLDTFALPQLWLILGLITATEARSQTQSRPDPGETRA